MDTKLKMNRKAAKAPNAATMPVVAPTRRRPRAMRLAVVAVAAALLPLLVCARSAEAAASQQAFAVIVNGDDSFTHNFNVSLALEALAHLQYPPQNTFVLAAKVEATDPGSAAIHWVAATNQGLEETTRALRTRMHAEDLLLIYLTGHGFRAFGHAELKLSRGSVSAESFMHAVSVLPFGKLILIADQCDSGGFVNAAGKLGRNVVAVSSADDHHEVRCEPFIRPFWQAAIASDPAGAGAASVEASFKAGEASLARSLGTVEQIAPQYLATGNCREHSNQLSVAPALAALASSGEPQPAGR
ncbi:MAG TPA: hypothetical protein VHR45_18760 [Thermoanaerobaculia bacterium]|nr:hypothetical protein [Thermoanaerobaculia bacterium]